MRFSWIKKKKKSRSGGASNHNNKQNQSSALGSTRNSSNINEQSTDEDPGKKAETDLPLTNETSSDNEDIIDMQNDGIGLNGTANVNNLQKKEEMNGATSPYDGSKDEFVSNGKDSKVDNNVKLETKKTLPQIKKQFVLPRAPKLERLSSKRNRLGSRRNRPVRSRRFSDSQPASEADSRSALLERREELLLTAAYQSIPELPFDKLPRGGISIETEAVGRVQVSTRNLFHAVCLIVAHLVLFYMFIQYGIPPETIKDSLTLGIDVPTIYIVPLERFCREMGPALGINLAEFEFPAYFQFFIKKTKITLVVEEEAETNICRVFNETLLGPAQFRRERNPIKFAEEDFAPDFDRETIPNFTEELKHFRKIPDGEGGITELRLELLIQFTHFSERREKNKKIGMPRFPEDLEKTIIECDESGMNEEQELQNCSHIANPFLNSTAMSKFSSHFFSCLFFLF